MGHYISVEGIKPYYIRVLLFKNSQFWPVLIKIRESWVKPIAESILSHHEWYNGQGYPRGIRGEEIPVLSRISSLINAYEAMTRDRPYRKKMTEEEAKKEIIKFSGIQFDPKIVETFFELLEGEGK